MAQPTDPSPLHTLAGSPERLALELRLAAETELAHAPYQWPDEKSPTRLERAHRWVLDGKVRPLSEDGQYFEVESSKGGKTYTVQGHHCLCEHADKGRSHWCYHAVAVELYRRTERRLLPPKAQAVPAPEATAQVPLANAAPEPCPQPAPAAVSPRPIAAILADLARPLPPACVAVRQEKSRDGSVHDIHYLHWYHVAQVLDAYAPGWQGQVARVDTVGATVAITYRLSIPAAEGLVTREATGQESEDLKGYGDPTSNAEAMAFKRAAAKFGVGRWLYERDDRMGVALAEHLCGGAAAPQAGPPRPSRRAQKRQIAELVMALAGGGDKAHYEQVVMHYCSLPLEEDYYGAIIEALTKAAHNVELA